MELFRPLFLANPGMGIFAILVIYWTTGLVSSLYFRFHGFRNAWHYHESGCWNSSWEREQKRPPICHKRLGGASFPLLLWAMWTFLLWPLAWAGVGVMYVIYVAYKVLSFQL